MTTPRSITSAATTRLKPGEKLRDRECSGFLIEANETVCVRGTGPRLGHIVVRYRELRAQMQAMLAKSCGEDIKKLCPAPAAVQFDRLSLPYICERQLSAA